MKLSSALRAKTYILLVLMVCFTDAPEIASPVAATVCFSIAIFELHEGRHQRSVRNCQTVAVRSSETPAKSRFLVLLPRLERGTY